MTRPMIGGTQTMRRFTTTIAALAFAATAAACSGNDATSPTVSIVGTYTLKSINGSPLPYNFGNGVTLTSDQLTMRADGSYSEIGNYNDGSSTSEDGFYTNNNGSITFNDETDQVTYHGSLSGRVLTEITNGFTATYQKN
jgi:hypothetical protein